MWGVLNDHVYVAFHHSAPCAKNIFNKYRKSMEIFYQPDLFTTLWMLLTYDKLMHHTWQVRDKNQHWQEKPPPPSNGNIISKSFQWRIKKLLSLSKNAYYLNPKENQNFQKVIYIYSKLGNFNLLALKAVILLIVHGRRCIVYRFNTRGQLQSLCMDVHN